MEGFVANTVILCIEEASDTNEYNNEFYKKVIKDNMMIFEITPESKVTIPQMKINDLKDILFKKLKINKVCDVYMLTVEHLRCAGDELAQCHHQEHQHSLLCQTQHICCLCCA